MNNIKDTITTVCGLIIAISGGIVLAAHTNMIAISIQIVNGCLLAGIIATSVLSYFSGKNPNGTTKTTEQINAQMAPNKAAIVAGVESIVKDIK